MQDKCAVCGIEGRKLFDTISNFRFLRLCSRCAFQEHATLIEKPTEEQIRKANTAYSVYERLAKAAGFEIKHNQLRKKKTEEVEISADFKKALDEEEPNSRNLKLIPNFAELLRQKMAERQITSEALAQQIGTHPDIISEAEKGFLKDSDTAKKIEQFFGITLFEEKKVPDYLKRLEEIQKNKKAAALANLGEGIAIDFKSTELKIGDLKKIKENLQETDNSENN